MRRFGWGGTNRPSMKRPGSAFGRMCYGAPGPCKDVEPAQEIVPEMFSENSNTPIVRTTYVCDFEDLKQRELGETTIDLRLD